MTHFLDGTDEDRPGLAAGLLLFALATLALQDAIARLAGEHISFWQFQAIRAACNIVLLLTFARAFMGGLPRRPHRPWAVAARVAAMVLATIFFFGGLPKVSIVEMAAGLYTYPIFVTLLSATFLGERIGIFRLSAVIVGAAGAMLILQPGGAEFELVKLMPIAAGFAYGCNIIITRRWCRGENAVTMAVSIAGTFVVIGTLGCITLTFVTLPQALRSELPYLTHGWRDMAGWVLGATLLCSVLNATANVLLTKAYQSAESSWLAPFDYSYLIFAAIMGLVLFDVLPGPLQVLGMALIAGSGIVTALRERQLKATLAAGLGTELPPPGTRG
ncbi:MAG: DMT family transporter [Paracoccaceae bacterium]